MHTVRDIIASFGGPAAFGRAIGITTERATTMRRRGSIPTTYWDDIIETAREMGIEGITSDTLLRARINSQGPKKLPRHSK